MYSILLAIIYAALQIILTIILFSSLPLWKKRNYSDENLKAKNGLKERLKIKGVKSVLLTFFAYCALEATIILWASSYLVEYRGTDSQTASKFAALFLLGITAGRFLSGFISDIFNVLCNNYGFNG